MDLAVERILESPTLHDVSKFPMKDYTVIKPYNYMTESEIAMEKDYLKHLPEYKKQFKLPLNAHACDNFLLDGGISLLSEKAKEYLKDKTFFDGGAYIGDSILTMLKYSPSKIYAFEISEENAYFYKQTMEMNHVSDEIQELVMRGLGEKSEIIKIQENGGAGGNIFCEGTQDLSIVSFDDFIVERNITNPGLIKLDIEGLEPQAIYGAVNTLKKYRPIIITATYHNPEEFFELKPYIENLHLGYKLFFRQLIPPVAPKTPLFHESWFLRHALPIGEMRLFAVPEELAD